MKKMKRRTFIEQSCFACMATIAGVTLLESCASSKSAVASPSFIIADGIVTLPSGSFSQQNYQVIKSSQLSEQVLVVKQPDNSYKAFEMKCTHKGAGLKVENDTELKCNLHGSKFSFDGQVLNGPAKGTLKSYEVEVAGTDIKIKVG
jgi:nitrite reductase/ring-hydroxylating ferredoxin subunit